MPPTIGTPYPGHHVALERAKQCGRAESAWNHAAALPELQVSMHYSLGKGSVLLLTGSWSKISEPERSEQWHCNDGGDCKDDEADDLGCCETRLLDDVVADPAREVFPMDVTETLGEGSEGFLCRFEGGVCCVVHGLFNRAG